MSRKTPSPPTGPGLEGKRILLGVTAGIGAYKAAELVRELRRRGAEVAVVMTPGATRFITPLTLETLSGNPVGVDLFSLTEERDISHIQRARWADLLLVAPATADFLGKAARGLADDLLSTILLAVRCPVAMAPAMNAAMWEKPAVQENLAILRSRGVEIVEPEEGEMACGEEGKGRLAGIPSLLESLSRALAGGPPGPRAKGGDLAGLRLLVTAGPTREPVDPVRYLGNRSSGKMGYALAAEALERGAEVVLVTGPVALPPPPGAEVRRVMTASEMEREVRSALPRCQWLVMAAAVADFRPREAKGSKIRRGGASPLALELVPTADILAGLKDLKGDRFFVGFAAETEELEKGAAAKLAAKGLDLVVGNDVSMPGAGFDSDRNAGILLSPGREAVRIPLVGKRVMAARVLDEALSLWRARRGG